MAFIRPELKEALSRFRDAVIGVGVSLFGIYWAINSQGFMSIVGTSLAVAGALLVFAGIQRGRFMVGSDGVGVVDVDEGQVTYFGPLGGGSVVIDDLLKVEYDATARPVAEWILHDPVNGELRIPTNAKGADALFDVFASLSGMQTEKMLAVLKTRRRKHVVIWQADRAALH
jgi:hypothetical protein